MAATWTDAELLSEGFAANASTLHAIQFRARLTNDQAAELCGISLRTYRRWLATGRPNAGALRLLAILAGYVPWDGWSGWEMHQGLLFPPGYSKHGIAPGEFFAVTYYRQSISAYRGRVVTLEAEIRRLKDASGRRGTLAMRVVAGAGMGQGSVAALGGCAATGQGWRVVFTADG